MWGVETLPPCVRRGFAARGVQSRWLRVAGSCDLVWESGREKEADSSRAVKARDPTNMILVLYDLECSSESTS